MEMLYVFIVLLAADKFFVAAEIPFLPPLEIINKYSNSVDIEWEFIDNFTIYKLAVINIVPHSTSQNLIVQSNKVTVQDLDDRYSYVLRLLGLPNEQCGDSASNMAGTALSKSILPLTLPKNVPREVIKSFKVDIRTSITASWKPVENASHYVLTYRVNGSCMPTEQKIITPDTQLGLAPIPIEHIRNNATYHFNVRVFNYTASLPSSDVTYPKADQMDISLLDVAPQLPSFKVVNKYSTSMDLEWNFIDGNIQYKVIVTTAGNAMKKEIMTRNNKVTISQLKPNVMYMVLLSVSSNGESKEMVKGVNFVTLPSQVTRQTIDSLRVMSKSINGNLTLNITWAPITTASYYVLTFRPNESVNETVIMTPSTQIETTLQEDVETIKKNPMYIFNVRVYNYTTATNGDVVYPKADQLEVTLIKNSLPNTAKGLASSEVALLIALVVSFCLA